MKPVSFPHSCREAALLKWFRLVFPGWDKSVSDDVKIFRCAANWTLAVVPAAFGQAGTPLDESQENMPMTLAAWGLEAWLGPLEAPHYCWAWKKIRFGTCSFNAVSHVCVMWLFHYRNQQLLMKLEASGIRKTSNFNFSLTSLSWIIKRQKILRVLLVSMVRRSLIKRYQTWTIPMSWLMRDRLGRRHVFEANNQSVSCSLITFTHLMIWNATHNKGARQ